MKGHILILDDDKQLLEFMDEHFSMNGFKTTAFKNPVKAIEYLEDHSVDLVVTDVKMNEMTGDEILAHVKKNHPDTGVIMITGFGNIQHSVNALRKGAYDYITKPFKAKEILFRVNRFFESGQTEPDQNGKKQVPRSEQKRKDEQVLKIERSDVDEETRFVGDDPHIKKLMRLLPKIARNDAPIMIQGESGTGKEVFAHLVHFNSQRANKPYVKINCANLPSELVESTLFGHIKGAFTGAVADKKGAFDQADGGTLLLDEITEIDIAVQAKLLRVLQENEFYRVGSQKPIQVDVRVIATSNRNIAEAISEGIFREDLYYRLNVFPISIPPLRYRSGDIPLLASHFTDRYTSRYGLGKKELSDELIEYLMNQEWRGNVRELDNKIHRGVILSQDSKVLKPEHIENKLFTNVDDEIGKEVLTDMPLMSIEDMELQLIKRALEHTRGNQKKAAKILGISDRTIRNKLKNMNQE